MGTQNLAPPSDSAIDRNALNALAGRVDELPLLPQVLVKIMQLDKEANDYFEQFEALAKEDPPFAVRVVALANSAASAPVSPITSIKESIIRMGAGTIGSLVASLSVQRVFVPTGSAQIGLWRHAVEAAVATSQIAQMVPALKLDPSHAYLAGLLHDIGRFVMLEHAEPNLQKVDETHWANPEELIQADMETFKFTHSELGYLACKKWGLPDILADVVRRHHDELVQDPKHSVMAGVTLCLQVADRMSIALFDNPELGNLTKGERSTLIAERCLRSAHEKALLDVDRLESCIETIQLESEQLLSGLGFSTH